MLGVHLHADDAVYKADTFGLACELLGVRTIS